MTRGTALTNEALAALDEAQGAWRRQDYSAVEQAYAGALASGQEALGTVNRVRGRNDEADRAYYNRLPFEPLVFLPVLGTCLAAGLVFVTRRR